MRDISVVVLSKKRLSGFYSFISRKITCFALKSSVEPI